MTQTYADADVIFLQASDLARPRPTSPDLARPRPISPDLAPISPNLARPRAELAPSSR